MRTLPAMLALVVAAGIGLPALAQAPPPAPALAPVPASASTAALAPALAPAPLSAKSLGAETGQGVGDTAIAMSDQQLSATSSGNSIVANVMRNGDVAFSTNALSGFSGVGNFVINTGNNSNLQGAISVTIVTSAAPPL